MTSVNLYSARLKHKHTRAHSVTYCRLTTGLELMCRWDGCMWLVIGVVFFDNCHLKLIIVNWVFGNCKLNLSSKKWNFRFQIWSDFRQESKEKTRSLTRASIVNYTRPNYFGLFFIWKLNQGSFCMKASNTKKKKMLNVIQKLPIITG